MVLISGKTLCLSSGVRLVVPVNNSLFLFKLESFNRHYFKIVDL